MADSKITALTSISTSTDPANDPLVIVDVSDTSMAATGTTKKVTLNQLLGASGTATLASATITGDLTVDTSTLKVDSANNRVGIGTASPAVTLDISDPSAVIRATSSTGTNTSFAAFANTGGAVRVGAENSAGGGLFTGSSAYSAVLGTTGAYSAHIGTNSTVRYSIASDGIATWSNVGGVAGTAMTLNSTGLGVGRTPSTYKLEVLGNAQVIQSNFLDVAFRISQGASTSGNKGQLLFTDSSGTTAYITGYGSAFGSGLSGALAIGVGASDRLIVDASGNCGIGVTPSAGKGCLQLSSGINFPATQVASTDANTLDDYEEGTFTPTIIGTSTAGTGIYSVQSGTYTKVGRLVSCQIFLNWTAHTGTGDMRISGLPFQVSGASNYFAAATIGYLNNVSLSAGNVATGYALNSTSVITLGQYPTGGGAATGIAMDISGEIVISVNYVV